MRDFVNVRFDFIDGNHLHILMKRAEYDDMLDNLEDKKHVFYDTTLKRDVIVNLNLVKLIVMWEIEQKKGWFSRWVG